MNCVIDLDNDVTCINMTCHMYVNCVKLTYYMYALWYSQIIVAGHVSTLYLGCGMLGSNWE